MPYIFEQQRQDLANGSPPRNSGELNYTILRVLVDYASHRPRSYDLYNEMVGVLECVKLEMYRRAVAVYENKKKEQNGDVEWP